MGTLGLTWISYGTTRHPNLDIHRIVGIHNLHPWEAFHIDNSGKNVIFAWPHLKHADYDLNSQGIWYTQLKDMTAICTNFCQKELESEREKSVKSMVHGYCLLKSAQVDDQQKDLERKSTKRYISCKTQARWLGKKVNLEEHNNLIEHVNRRD